MAALSSFLPKTVVNHVFSALLASAFVTYRIFKRFEPDNLFVHFFLLVVPPFVSSILLLAHLPISQAFLSSFALHAGVILLCTVIYRLSPFHPLAHYPGPIALKISRLPMTWVTNGGFLYIYVKQLHDQYGDIVRIGPNEVSIRNSDALIGVHTLPKEWINSKMSFSKSHSLITETNIQEHLRRRKPWNRAFNSAALKDYEELIAKRATDLVDKLLVKKQTVDLGKWIDYFTFDFMSDMAFGGGSEMIEKGDNGSNWHVLTVGMSFTHVLGTIPWIVIYARRIPALSSTIQRMIKLGVGLARNRLKAGAQRRDLFYFLNNEDGVEPVAPPFPEVVSNGTLAMIAGAETTSVTLTNLFYLILKDGKAYKRLQEEIDKFFPPDENALDTTTHAEMPFLNAVINETLRLIPVVPNGSKRRVPHGSGGKMAGPYFLPEGTLAAIHFYALHRDAKNFFPSPEGFWPDRWLVAAQPASAPERPEGFVHNTDAFVPFSSGPNNCVGKGLALQEMRMLVALLMQTFEMRFAEGWDADRYEAGLRDFLTLQKKDLMIVLTPRRAA